MKTRHDGDCTIYSSLSNQRPEDGICTCGYGHQLVGGGDYSEMYSKELQEKMREEMGEIEMSEEEFFEMLKEAGFKLKGEKNDNRN